MDEQSIAASKGIAVSPPAGSADQAARAAAPAPAAEASPPASLFPASVRVSIVGSFLILGVGALYYARSFFLPVVLAILLTLALTPVVRFLAHRRIPAAVSAVLMILLLGGALVLASLSFSAPLSHLLAETPQTFARLGERLAFLGKPVSALSNASHEVDKITGAAGAENSQSVVIAQPGPLGWIAGTAADIGTTLGATLILSLFLLANRDTLRLKLVRVIPLLSGKKRSLRLLRDIEDEVSRYLLTITAINLGVGVCVALEMALLGMPDPPLWGVGAALLNYVPFLGALAGECLAFGIAAVTFPSLTQALLPPLVYLAIQMVEANFVTPAVLGRRLELSPVAILVSLALGTWMWGIMGTILGVPVLVVIKVFADNSPALSGLAEFLSAEVSVPADEETAVAAAAVASAAVIPAATPEKP